MQAGLVPPGASPHQASRHAPHAAARTLAGRQRRQQPACGHDSAVGVVSERAQHLAMDCRPGSPAASTASSPCQLWQPGPEHAWRPCPVTLGQLRHCGQVNAASSSTQGWPDRKHTLQPSQPRLFHGGPIHNGILSAAAHQYPLRWQACCCPAASWYLWPARLSGGTGGQQGQAAAGRQPAAVPLHRFLRQGLHSGMRLWL